MFLLVSIDSLSGICYNYSQESKLQGVFYFMMQVITHNGKPPGTGPNQGGKRLGYIFTRANGTLGSVPEGLLAVVIPPPPPEPVFAPLMAKKAMAAVATASGGIFQTNFQKPNTHPYDAIHGDVQCDCGSYMIASRDQTETTCWRCKRTIHIAH